MAEQLCIKSLQIFEPDKSLRDVARKVVGLSTETLRESYHRLCVPDGLIGKTGWRETHLGGDII